MIKMKTNRTVSNLLGFEPFIEKTFSYGILSSSVRGPNARLGLIYPLEKYRGTPPRHIGTLL